MFNLFKKKITFDITIIVEADEDRFHAYCPSFKGLHVEGNTEEEACKNALNAAVAYIHSLIKHGDPVPLFVEIENEPFLPMGTHQHKCVRQVPVTI